MASTMNMEFTSIAENDGANWSGQETVHDARSDKYNLIREAEKSGSLLLLREMALTRGGLVNRE